MKFLCGNCKAKYQIADEKVSGRTLRMKCRRCGHDILIDGHNMPQSTPSSPAPAPRRTGSSTVSVMPGPGRGGSSAQALPARPGSAGGSLPRPGSGRSKPPSGLSADFRRHVAAPPEVPQRSAPYDLWHVAIQDVPVGPMTRDELARKIDAGAVTPESLCWREGMDDWRPLGDLPELAQLLRRPRDASRPRGEPARALRGEPSRTSRGRPPPSVPGGQSHSGSRSAPLPLAQVATEESVDEENAEPTRISEFMPPIALVSPHVPAPAPTYTPQAQPQQLSPNTQPKVVLPAPAPAAVGTSAAAPLASVETAVHGEPKSASIFNPGSIAVGLLIGILLVGGPMLYRNTWGSQPAPAPAAVAPQAKVETPRAVEPVAVDPSLQVSDDTTEEVKPNAPAARATARAGAGAKPVKPEPEKPVGKQLSEADKKRLAAMSEGSSDPDLTRLATRGEQGGGAGATQPSLTPQQLGKVVQDNKSALQRCYETALRAAGGKSDAAIKISVNVVVGGSGIAKSVNTSGEGLGNMTDCIRGAVKRWHFPQAQGESEFAFPLVFQPGA